MSPTFRVATFDLSGSEVAHSLSLADYTWSPGRNDDPGHLDGDINMLGPRAVARADVEPGQRDYVVYVDEVPMAAGRIWAARVTSALASGDAPKVNIVGNGYWSVFSRRLVDEIRFAAELEDPTVGPTYYALSQEDIVWQLIANSQAKTGGDLGITQGSHTGTTSVFRDRWWCTEDGVKVADAADEFADLEQGLDWCITPTLTDATLKSFRTWCPFRGEDLTSSVVLEGTHYLDNLVYEVDAGNVLSRVLAIGDAQCAPAAADDSDASNLAAYGLLEDLTTLSADSDLDVEELARETLDSQHFALQPFDISYLLDKVGAPQLGDFDIGDLITFQAGDVGWELDLPVRVDAVEVHCQMEFPWVKLTLAPFLETGS